MRPAPEIRVIGPTVDVDATLAAVNPVRAGDVNGRMHAD